MTGCAWTTPHRTASARHVNEIFVSLTCFIGFEFGDWESFGVVKLEQKSPGGGQIET
jgi:hypothetical protein